MTSKTSLISLAVWLAAGSLCFGSAFDGTWKLNAKKSHMRRGMGRNETVKYEGAFFFKTKVTVDGHDAKGKAAHNEWVGMFNGTDYEVTGDPDSDARAYNKVDDHTLNFSMKKGGKVVGTGKIVVSPDGKTRTVTISMPGRRHRMVRTTSVYDKVGG
jgi:hypothetical protein